MIKLEVEEYCQECRAFKADVEMPIRFSEVFGNENPRYPAGDPIQTDTIVRCEQRNRCEAIKRYLERRMQM